MITDNFQKSSHFFVQQQEAPWWLSGIGSASGRGKECMRSFCKRAPEQVRLKFAVELLPLWQLGKLANVTEIIFYSWEAVAPFSDPTPRTQDPLAFVL